jgi:hypothetical protein
MIEMAIVPDCDHAGQFAVFLGNVITVTRLRVAPDRGFAHRFEQAAGSFLGKLVRDVLAGEIAKERADAWRITRSCCSNVHLSFA